MRLTYFLALLCVPLIVGCEGCRNEADEDPQADNEEAAVDDFTSKPAMAFPADEKPIGGGVKPGHWMTASQSLKSNKVDTRGELQSQSFVRTTSTLEAATSVLESGIKSRRPIVLPKGQSRRFDYRLLTPMPGMGDQRSLTISSRFVSAGRGTFFDTGRQPFSVLAPQEYFFVILTSRPQRFTQIQVADWVAPFRDELSFKDAAANFRVIFPATKEKGVLPLSETMLDWTNTAFVLWDDVDANALMPGQQRAMADWIRFGGQLIVNGAVASDAVAKTQLAEVLPLKPTGNIELNPDSVAELLSGWSIKDDPSTKKQIVLAESQSGVSVDGQLNPGAVAIPKTGNLVLHRQIGRGRVVQPRFDLTSEWLQTWKSHDGFINSVVLLRPRRRFRDSTSNREFTGVVEQEYVDFPLARTDATMNTNFRITARDAILRTGVEGGKRKAALRSDSRRDTLTYVDKVSGISGWNDSSDTLNLCQKILKDESGIEIPESKLVLRSLSWYLLILVPLNYIVFRLMGRLEYAWLAVPVIALIGAVWVARAARLDIGFARSQTEIGVLELSPDYPRGHLTRMVAIYNSLSDEYNIQFKTVDGAAALVGGYSSEETGDPVFQTSFEEGPSLSGVAVKSNNVRLIHTEEMIDVGGGMRLDGESLINETQFEYVDSFVVKKDESGGVLIATVGLCESSSKSKLRFRSVESLSITEELPMQVEILIRRLGAPAAMPNASARFVGRVTGAVPGVTITPSATQRSVQTVVLAHLQNPPLPEAKIDVNLLSKFLKVQQENFEKELEAESEDE